MTDIVERLRNGTFTEEQEDAHSKSIIRPSPAIKIAADTIEALRAENARLTEMLGNVSRGVQAIRVEQNVAAVWLPAIQEIRAYFRELDAARAAMGETE